ncbi:MAG: hypothetical protein IKD69_12865 [Solobacterium sp.]|nr:hypothetical protein [Solobacterium sp.]
MNICVIYHSDKDNMRQVAEAIAKKCGVKAIDIDRPHNLGDCDLLFVGTTIQHGRQDTVLMDYLDNLPVNRIKGAAVFSIHRNRLDRTEQAVNLLEHKGIAVYRDHCVVGEKRSLFRTRVSNEDIRRAIDFASKVLLAFNG